MQTDNQPVPDKDALDQELDEYWEKSGRKKKTSLELVESETEDYYQFGWHNGLLLILVAKLVASTLRNAILPTLIQVKSH